MSKPEIKWTTPGKVLARNPDGTASVHPIEDGNVKVTEAGNSFYLPDLPDEPIAGIPVDANLGIYLIKKLYDKLNKCKDIPPEEDLTTTEKWLIGLLTNSRAISIDKNVLLKTISQPGCEGLRFYLCMKEVLEEGLDPVEVLSLMTVGIDAEGKDLGYEFNSATANEIKVDGKFNVITKSLLSEFDYPPPSGGFPNGTYVIGGYAWPDIS